MNSFAHQITPKSETAWLIWIVLIGLGIRLLVLFVYPHLPESDEIAYLSMARNFVTGKGLIDSAGNYAMYNVGYPLFIVSPVILVFGDSLTAIRIANALLGVCSILMCYSVARAAGASKLGRLLAALVFSVYLPTCLYSVYVFKENLMIPLMLGIVWCALRLMDRVQPSIVLACGALLGFVALTGNAALSLGLTVAFALLSSSRSKTVRNIGWLGVVVLTAVVVSTPWMIRNFQVLGTPVLNTNGGFNLYLGNNPNASGMYMSIAETPRGSSWNDLRKSGEVQASDTLKREAVEWISSNPTEFVRLAVRKLLFFWTPPLHEGKSSPSQAERAVRVGWAIQFFVLAAAAAGSVCFKSLRNRHTAILWLAIASYTAVHMLFYVIFRYREPIFPFVCILAAMCIEQLFARVFTRAGNGPDQLATA
jgi:4-amino-4-deoxy-L-arabinose transferase-like glycosyltransferase